MEGAFYFYIVAPLIILLLLSLASRRSFPGRNNRSGGWQHPPSPPWRFPIIGHLHLLSKTQPLHRTLANLCDKHDAPVLLLHLGCRNVLVVSSPAVAEECLSTHDLAFANRPRFAVGKYLTYNYSTVGTAPYGPLWRNLRRLITTEVLSNHRLGDFSSIRSEEIRFFIASLVREVSPASGPGSPLREPEFRKVTLRPLIFRLVFNNIIRMMVGTRYSEEGTDAEEIGRFGQIIVEIFMLFGSNTNITDFLPWLRWLGFTGLEKRMITLQKNRDDLLQGMIDKQRRKWSMMKQGHNQGPRSSCQEQRRETVVDAMLSMQEEDPEYYTDDIIKGVIVDMISAGSDTSSLTIEWVMSLLLNHPNALNMLDSEIRSAMEPGRLLDESDLSRLPYLRAVINETLRLYPAGPLLVPHESREDCTVSGFQVPSGTMLLINVWAVHRNVEVWSDPLEFMPERFLQGGTDVKTFAFGSGRRRCPGEGMAMRMVGLTVAVLVQCFDWERVGRGMVDMQEGMGLTMPKAVPLEAMCRPREEMLNASSL